MKGNIGNMMKQAQALQNNHVLLLIIAFLGGWFVLWYSRFPTWENTLDNLLTLMELGGQTHADALLSIGSKASQYGYNVLDYALRTELSTLVIASLALLALPLVALKLVKSRSVEFAYLLYAPLAVLGLLIVALAFLNLGFGPMRMLFYVFAIGTLLAGYWLYGVLQRLRSSRWRIVPLAGVCLILALAAAIFANGVLTLYPSPYLLKSSDQTTRQEMQGMSWLFNERSMNADITGLSMAAYRYGDAMLSPEAYDAQVLHRFYPTQYAAYNISLSIPYHFGYDGNSSLSSAFSNNVYVLFRAQDLSMYRDVIPAMAPSRFTEADYARLAEDPGLFELYTNGEMSTWYSKLKPKSW